MELNLPMLKIVNKQNELFLRDTESRKSFVTKLNLVTKFVN